MRPAVAVPVYPVSNFAGLANFIERDLPNRVSTPVLTQYNTFYEPFMRRFFATIGRPPTADYSGFTLNDLVALVNMPILIPHDDGDTILPAQFSHDDGKVGNNTYTRIEIFQKKILNTTKPDGRVDPKGRTFNMLVNRPRAKSALSMSVSTKAIDLLKAIEELATKPYDDQTGKDITSWVKGATIGYGHLIAKSDWRKYHHGMTKMEALALFTKDLSPYAMKVKNSVTAKITQNEFDAMVILTFNIGKSGFGSSSVLKLVNNPGVKTSYSSLEKAWMAWTKSQGKQSKGLVNRRKSEWNIYSKNIYKRW